MYKYYLILLLAFTCHSAFYSFQQNWTQGPGVQGPDPNWGESFYQCSNIQWWAYDPEMNYYPQMELDHYYMTLVDTGSAPFVSLASVDIDGDSHYDLIASSGYSNMVYWWRNDLGNGTEWTAHTVTTEVTGAFSVEAGDVNDDGYTDIVTAARFDDEIAWWENTDGTGTQWTKHVVADNFDGADKIVLCDVDGDNDTDIVASAIVSTDVLWFENIDSQGTTWAPHTVSQPGSFVRAMETADVDGDGDEDVVGYYPSWNLVWWDNTDGTGLNWTERIVCNTINGVSDIAVADMNGDSFLDVVTVKEYGYWMVCSHANDDGSGQSWTTTVVQNYSSGGTDVDVYDHDNDGDMDIIACSTVGWLVKLWENMDGSGTDWHRFCIEGQFVGVSDVCAQDYDGDGIMDVAAVSNQETVAWWKDSTYKSTGWLESTITNNYGEISYILLTASLDIPPGTSVQIQLRASNNFDEMGAWGDPLPVPCDLSGMFPETQYLQYLVTLSTTDPGLTPSMNNIFVHYDELGVEGESGTGLQLIGPATNPSTGTPSATFHTPEETIVEFTLFDLSGRIAARVTQTEYSPGTHCISLPDVPPGTYILQMKAGDVTDRCRMVIIR